MEEDATVQVSRRQALAALSTIGIASAGAGVGTTAFLNDEEGFEDNTIQAGTLNLVAEVDLVYSNRDGIDVEKPNDANEADPYDELEVDGSVSKAAVDVDNVLPGDEYIIRTDLTIEGNPGRLLFDANEQADVGGATVEPEPSDGIDNSTADGDAKGDLDDAAAVRFYNGGNDAQSLDNQLYTVGDQSGDEVSDPSDLGQDTDGDTTAEIYELEATQATTDNSDLSTTPQTNDPTFDSVANDNLNPDGTYGDPRHGSSPNLSGLVVHEGSTTPGAKTAPQALPTATYRWFWYVRVPTTVGNAVQADRFRFEIEGVTEQARDNATPFEHL